jgi:type IV pilus assembly protein PilX
MTHSTTTGAGRRVPALEAKLSRHLAALDASVRQHPSSREDGAVLLTVLSILLALMIVGVASARVALDDARSARHERDRQLAFHAAEAAQRDALVKLGELVCLPESPSGPPAWLSYDLGGAVFCIEYGVLSGAVMATGAGALPASVPGLVIEPMPLPPGAVPADYYRITSVGFGSEPGTHVVLQSVVRVGKGGKKMRLSWREVGNWREQHDALH